MYFYINHQAAQRILQRAPVSNSFTIRSINLQLLSGNHISHITYHHISQRSRYIDQCSLQQVIPSYITTQSQNAFSNLPLNTTQLSPPAREGTLHAGINRRSFLLHQQQSSTHINGTQQYSWQAAAQYIYQSDRMYIYQSWQVAAQYIYQSDRMEIVVTPTENSPTN